MAQRIPRSTHLSFFLTLSVSLVLFSHVESLATWKSLCGSWEDPTAWDVGHVPIDEDVTLPTNANGPYSVILDNPATTISGDLTLENGTILIVRSDFAVKGTLIIHPGAILDMTYSPLIRVVTLGGVQFAKDLSCTVRFVCTGTYPISLLDSSSFYGCSGIQQTKTDTFSFGCQWDLYLTPKTEVPEKEAKNWLYQFPRDGILGPDVDLMTATNPRARFEIKTFVEPEGIYVLWIPKESGYKMPDPQYPDCSDPLPTVPSEETSIEFGTTPTTFFVQFDLEGTPNHVIQVKDKCGRARDDRWVNVRFVRISEFLQTPNGTQVLQAIYFDQRIYTVTSDPDDLFDSVDFATTFFQQNGNLGFLNFLFQVFETPTTLSFGGIDFQANDTDGKWSFDVSRWDFLYAENETVPHEMEMEILLTSDESSPFLEIHVENSTELTTYLFVTEEYTMKLVLLSVAEVGGAIVSVSHSAELLGGSYAVVSIIFPSFGENDTLVYDPLFSVLAGADSLINEGIDSCEEEEEDDEDNQEMLPVILVAVLTPTAIVLVCIAVMFLAIPIACKRKRLQRQLSEMLGPAEGE